MQRRDFLEMAGMLAASLGSSGAFAQTFTLRTYQKEIAE